MDRTPTSTADPQSKKAVLFCPDCDRELAFPERWLHERDPAPERLDCPECHRTVVDRRRQESRATWTAVWSPYTRLVSTWLVGGDTETADNPSAEHGHP